MNDILPANRPSSDFIDNVENLSHTLLLNQLSVLSEERDVIDTDPTYIATAELFEHNQLPFLEFFRPLILGLGEEMWKPTMAHFLIKIIDEKNILRR